MDLSQLVGLAFVHARWVGVVLLAAGVAVRMAGRALSRALLAAGILAAAGLAYQEWAALHSVLVSGGILLLGAAFFGVLAWTLRGLTFLVAFVLVAVAVYLLLFGWMGPSFVGTTFGSLTWGGATILTMIATGSRGGVARRVPLAAIGAGLSRWPQS